MRARRAQGILGRVTPSPDRLRDVVDVVLEALDEGLDGRALAIGGRDIPPRDQCSIASLQTRLATVQPHFAALVRRIRDRGEWDDVFVDALCTPPVSFTFGSVIAHILTASVVRRQTIIGALSDLGIQNVEMRDPIEWERMIAARG